MCQTRFHIIFLPLDATCGYSCCDNFLWSMKQANYNAVIYTNIITSLRNEFAWNEELQVPTIYIRNKDGEFERIDKLTNRELRQGHNIMKMYMSGEFDKR